MEFSCISSWSLSFYVTCTKCLHPALNSGTEDKLSHLMRLWYLSHRRPAKAQASLRIRAVSPEPSLFAHTKYRNR